MIKQTLFLLFLLSTGCASITIQTGATLDPSRTYEEYFDAWLFGFVSNGQTEVPGVCTNGQIAEIRSYNSIEDILLGTLLMGIYLPRTHHITCSQGDGRATQN